MSIDQLEQIARAMVAPGKGIIAIDESNTTIKKRFDGVGIDCTEENRRFYREMLLTTPQLSDHISGAILYDETLRQSSIEFNHFLCDIMNARMGEFVGMLAASRLRGPEMQVARALLMLADDRSSDAQEFSIPQHELALISGLSRQRVNMALSAFRRLGLVRGESHKGPLVVDVPHLRRYVVAEDLRAGHLVEVLPGFTTEPRKVHSMHPAGRRLPARVRVFLDHIALALRGLDLDSLQDRRAP